MPYLLTTKRPCPGCNEGETHARSSHAVATLEEAQQRARQAIHDSLPDFRPIPAALATTYGRCSSIPESGGTVGPLLDGTVVEVEHLTLDELHDLVHPDQPIGPGYERPHPDDHVALEGLMDAFNQRQQVRS